MGDRFFSHSPFRLCLLPEKGIWLNSSTGYHGGGNLTTIDCGATRPKKPHNYLFCKFLDRSSSAMYIDYLYA
jgi:hypothetical protein